MKNERDQEFKNILEELKNHPEVFSRVEPPVGYEKHLLHTLNKKLNRPSIWFIANRSVRRWGWAIGMCGVAFFVLSFFVNNPFSTRVELVQAESMLIDIANKGGEELVDHWTAVQGDVLSQRSIASDFSVIVAKMDDEKKSEKLIKKLEKESL